MLKAAIILTMLLSTPSSKKKSPIMATALSVLPGGGQFYTENYLKGAFFAIIQTSLLVFTIKTDPKKEYNLLGWHYTRYDLFWVDALVWTLSMADAYVSAHFYKFKEESKIGIEIGFKI